MFAVVEFDCSNGDYRLERIDRVRQVGEANHVRSPSSDAAWTGGATGAASRVSEFCGKLLCEAVGESVGDCVHMRRHRFPRVRFRLGVLGDQLLDLTDVMTAVGQQKLVERILRPIGLAPLKSVAMASALTVIWSVAALSFFASLASDASR